MSKIKLLMNAADETWLKSLDEEQRLAGLAYIDFKKVMGLKAQSCSRPELFMQAFDLGWAVCQAKLAEGLAGAMAKEGKENLPAEHL